MKLVQSIIVSLFLFSIFIFKSNYVIAQDYYPLGIGDRWNYYTVYSSFGTPPDTSYLSVQVIGDSILQNNQTYFVLSRSDLIGGSLVRADTNFIYYYNTFHNSEDTIINLSVLLNDPYFPESEYAWSVELISIDTMDIFGFSSRTLQYRLDGLILRYVNLSDKFGLYHLYSPGEPPWPGSSPWSTELYYTVIGGEEYGNPVSVEDENPVKLSDFSLSQNYPNPFNPETKIKFYIPETGFVTLKVYDLLGNEVSILVNDEKTSGNYVVRFDASDLPSGIYFYVIQIWDFVECKKMVLLK
ncbi:MAG: T9SS type A sorting domain-containing protein [Ignavibacteria bacterium]|jgi:hypothetical protein